MTLPAKLKANIEAALKSKKGSRIIVGIAGPPGSGKSTLSSLLLEDYEKVKPGMAKIVPMDGFHLSNEKLEELGLLSLKGIPDSFDAAGFVRLMDRLKGSREIRIPFPLFDRSIEKVIPDGDFVDQENKLLIVEGNYLLYDKIPWNQIQHYLDYSIYLDAGEDILFPRLLERHKEGGKSEKEAEEKVLSTDIPNARLVARSKEKADYILTHDWSL